MNEATDTESACSRRQVLAGTALAATAGLSGCLGGLGASRDATDTVTETYALSDAESLTVSTPNGSVAVTGEQRDDVELTAGFAATDEDQLNSMTVAGGLHDGTLRVTVSVEDSDLLDSVRPPRADLELRVPASLALKTVDVSTGDVDVEHVAGVAQVDASTGDVALEDVGGRVGVDASTGDVTLSSVDGQVRVETSTGDVTVERAKAGVDVTTSTGDAEVITASGPVGVETATGDVTVSSTEDGVAVETSTGDIDVRSIGGDATLETSSGDTSATHVDGVVRK